MQSDIFKTLDWTNIYFLAIQGTITLELLGGFGHCLIGYIIQYGIHFLFLIQIHSTL